MVKKVKQEMDTADNNRVYARARKTYLAGRGIKCSFCEYHRNENASRSQRSWKKHRKTQHK